MLVLFTERAKQTVEFAREEAGALRHESVGTEHILLGLLREQEGVAARVLNSLDITLDQVRAQVATRRRGRGQPVAVSQIPLTPRATSVLDLAVMEALRLGHLPVGTEHILLSLVHKHNDDVAAAILRNLGADAETIRTETMRVGGWPEPVQRRPQIDQRQPIQRRPQTGDHPADADTNDLTPAEWQIAASAEQGSSNREIGAQLFMSPKTVEAHLTHIYGKLGLCGRDELADWYRKHS